MLRWKEPAAFKRAIARQDGEKPNRWYQLLFTLGIVAVGLGGAAFHNQPAFDSWPITFALAAGCGSMIAFGVPFIAARDPNLIVITERGIGRRMLRGTGVVLEAWPWEQIAFCSLESMSLESRSYDVLVVTLHDGAPVVLALSSKVGVSDLAAAISAHGGELRNGDDQKNP